MNSRIKQLRKTELNLSQDAFAKKLKLTSNYISLIESGARTPSDRTISDICKVFNVSERWLRNGEGEMFVPLSRSEEIGRFAGTVAMEDSFRSDFVAMLAELSPEEWQLIEKMARRLSGTNKKGE